MFSIRQTTTCFVAGLFLCSLLTILSWAAPPDGKGKPGGGGEEPPPPPPPLPVGLDVRYRVQYVPIPENHVGFVMQDVNDSYEAVGWYSLGTNDGNISHGFYYNAATREFLSATEMVPSLTGSTQFTGINNLGWIVGSLADSSGLRSGILVYPDPTADTGWSSMPIPRPANSYEYYPRNVNDYGDVVGAYWRRNPDGTRGSLDAFAYNPGLDVEADFLDVTVFGLTNPHLYSIQVDNEGRGLAVDEFGAGAWWFDFGTASIYPVALPQSFYINVTGLGNTTLSNDGQLAVVKELAEFVPTNKKGNQGYYTYTYFPGVVQDGNLLWDGSFEGKAYIVNSVALGNTVGDVLGYSNGFVTEWLQHANWGYLDIESMLVFDPPEVGQVLSDEDIWVLSGGDVSYQRMADRDATGFGMIGGDLHGVMGEAFAFVLMPEFVSP